MLPCAVMDNFIAKSNPRESIRSHTDKLARLLADLLQQYPESLNAAEGQLVAIAAEYHDYGKAIYQFQRDLSKLVGEPFLQDQDLEELYRSLGHFPHGYVSPAFLPINKLRKSFGDMGACAVINAIFYHHNRSAFTDSQIRDVITEDLKPRLGQHYPLCCKYLSLVQKNQSFVKDEDWLLYAIVKGMLNRLDYAASAACDALEEPRLQNGSTFGEIVQRKLTERFPLRAVQEYMKSHHDQNLVVVASTGIGKTEAACLWAGGDKLFYTLPLKVSINAIYKRLHGTGPEEYGFHGATLLHADALQVLIGEEDEAAIDKYQKSRLFAYPVTVCTVDQLFTFVYRYRGSEIIPAVLKYSRVVVDEIQAYSPEIGAKLILGLTMIGALGGKFALITATMPPFLEDALAKAMKKKGIAYTRPAPFFSPLSRHILRYAQGDFDLAKIAELGKCQKVLIICNTVKKACSVYAALRESTAVHLLHSRFKQAHRRLLEEDILAFSQGDQVGIWVTTQIVEASLDIDFDVLFTEMCTADSLLQRLGRCWRKRSYTRQVPNVFIQDTKNGVGTVYDEEIYSRSVAQLQKYCGRIFTEQEKDAYVCGVYDTKALKSTKYYAQFLNAMATLESTPPAFFTAAEAKKKFRAIASCSVLDDADYNAMVNSGLMEELAKILRFGDKKEKAMARQRFLDHTVSIDPRYVLRKLNLHAPILGGCNPGVFPTAYRIQSDYDFDEISHTGLGLTLDSPADCNFI